MKLAEEKKRGSVGLESALANSYIASGYIATYRGFPLPDMSTYKNKRHSRAIC